MKEKDPIEDMVTESELDPAEYTAVVDVLSALRVLVPEQAPEPSAALVALLSAGAAAPLAAARSRRRAVLLSAVLASTVFVGTGAAAAANSLPEPAQRFLNEFSERYLPFEFPPPEESVLDSPTLPREAPGKVPPSRTGHLGGTDEGRHVGGGTGAGKTGNPGNHNGSPGEEGKSPPPAKGKSDPPAKGKSDPPAKGKSGSTPAPSAGNGKYPPKGSSRPADPANGRASGSGEKRL